MDMLLTFLEGIITFVSPCLLPMLPLYLAYVAGQTMDGTSNLRATLIGTLGFITGFSAVFCCLGAFAGTIGSLFATHRTLLDIICGVIIILMGLAYLGIIPLPMLFSQHNAGKRAGGFFPSLVFGAVFAISWTPCVGAFLASALSLAANSASTAHGVLLLLCYSLGLGLPFAASALLFDQLSGAFAWIKKHYAVIEKVSGILLILMGILMATGLLGSWLRLFSSGL